MKHTQAEVSSFVRRTLVRASRAAAALFAITLLLTPLPASATAESTLLTTYYNGILHRAPDAGGLAYWTSIATASEAMGVPAKDVFMVIAANFFASGEYQGTPRTNAQFVAELFAVFVPGTADAAAVAYWNGQLSQGLPRDVTMAAFMLAPTNDLLVQGVFGVSTSTPEAGTVAAFYRGFLGRLPDTGGYSYYLAKIQAGQCQGTNAVASIADAMSVDFVNSGEYVGRNRSNTQYVADLYNAILDRGADLGGLNYWSGKLDSGTETRDQVRRDILGSAEFAGKLSSMATTVCSASMSDADAVRLLEQSTFGPTDALVTHVKTVGLNAFLDEQFAAPTSSFPAFQYAPTDSTTFCAASTNPQCQRDNYTLYLLQNAFWTDALFGSDQLRQRVAFALSQILVTSGIDIPYAYAMAGYQQILRDNAFGNYETLLSAVTLSSVMGDYLDMVNNDKPAGTVQPNENYARELMQLFSIGVWELNPDGTQMLDNAGNPMPSYDQDEIEGFAHVFTGWTYPVLPGGTPARHNPRNYLGAMAAFASNHDTTEKILLGGVKDAANKTMSDDLAFAIHDVFMHPNVGPFIGKQLIQKLVTANPSPQYVARVSAVFDNNGAGVRGDLKAVVRAILTDPEARGDVKNDASYGKLREPVLFMLAAARAVNTASDGVFFAPQSSAMGQDLFRSGSVFNYYPPTYILPGSTSLAPEFALQNATSAFSRYNFANTFAFGTIAPVTTLPGATGTQPSWATLQALAATPTALIAKLNALLLHGTMTPAMQASLLTAINAVSATDTLTRAKTAFYLTITSGQYQVER